ncbi:hypothetical protein E3N88_13792 [Mikania micrantha]|uniref:CCHC-type domain-containing protein n=1 Tax=Mikania micrantha TaxID=192012 RepID=A0A5N6NZY9_9ASTR|nr:hypothetical protein E3N88_13792 [Mikania micrantha]
MERKINSPGKQAKSKANKSVGTSKSSLSEDQSSDSIKRNQQQHSPNSKTICLMCGEKNHFAADCFYNPRSRISSKLQGRGRKNSWSKTSTSSEEQRRNPVKKVSEASTSDNRKKQNKKASEMNTSEAKKREASDRKGTSKDHKRKVSNKQEKTFSFGRRPSEGKGKVASDDYQRKQSLPTTQKAKQVWKKKESTDKPSLTSEATTSSVPPRMMSKKFTYNDANDGYVFTFWLLARPELGVWITPSLLIAGSEVAARRGCWVAMAAAWSRDNRWVLVMVQLRKQVRFHGYGEVIWSGCNGSCSGSFRLSLVQL